MKDYLKVFRTAKNWLDNPDILDTIEEETEASQGTFKNLPTCSVDAKEVVCVEFTTEPRQVTGKDGKNYAWAEALLLEPAKCWFKQEDEEKQMPTGTAVAMNLLRHTVLRRCLADFEPLEGKRLAIANLGRVIKTKRGKAFDYRALPYDDLKTKMKKKQKVS